MSDITQAPDPSLPAWRQGFVFMDGQQRPYLVAPWGGGVWLFFWHVEGHWTSQREVSLGDQLRYRQQQEACGAESHEAWGHPGQRT